MVNENIHFTKNYTDHSTDTGFQFEFFCDRCGNGFRTHFTPYAAGTAAQLLNSASSLFGGFLDRAANASEHVRSAGYQKAKDAAFIKAIEELKPEFIQCPRCSNWVCKTSCWNTKKGLCKQCAPDLGVEMSAAQSSRSVEEIWAHAAMAEEDKHLGTENWRKNIRASCPECGKSLATDAKFCPECGAKLVDDSKCPQCGTKLQPGAKFCAECGFKITQ